MLQTPEEAVKVDADRPRPSLALYQGTQPRPHRRQEPGRGAFSICSSDGSNLIRRLISAQSAV